MACNSRPVKRQIIASQDGRDQVQYRAGKNWETREAAIAFAQKTIDFRADKNAAYMAKYNARHATAA